MKHLVPKPDHVYEDDPYPSDVQRIVQVCLKNNFLISYNDAKHIWTSYSDTYAAGWLFLPKDDNDLFRMIFDHSLVIEE